MKNVCLDFLSVVGRYLITVVGGTGLFMLVAPIVGYLAYGDRPGPVWHTRPLQLDWRAFGHYLVGMLLPWLLYLAVDGLVVAAIASVVVRLAQRLNPRVLLVRALGATVSTTLTFFLLAGLGWYISLGWAAGIVGSLLAAYFGAFQLPNRRPVAAAA